MALDMAVDVQSPTGIAKFCTVRPVNCHVHTCQLVLNCVRPAELRVSKHGGRKRRSSNEGTSKVRTGGTAIV